MKAEQLMNEVMKKAQALDVDQMEPFFTLMCSLSIGILRGVHDDEFVNDFLDAAKRDNLTITPQKLN